MGFTQCTFTYTYFLDGEMVSLDRKRFDINDVVFMYLWRNPITEHGGVLITDMRAAPDWKFMGSVPAFIGGFTNDDEFWEMADAHARMMLL